MGFCIDLVYLFSCRVHESALYQVISPTIARSDKVAGDPVFFFGRLPQGGDFFTAWRKFGQEAARVEIICKDFLLDRLNIQGRQF